MRLTFACELGELPLQVLFADEDVVDTLKELRAGVSLGIRDLSVGRATVVRQLNKAGIPVVAWLLLPESEGYWFNADNGPRAVARYTAFQDWTSRYGLVWDRIGIDIEPDINEMQQLVSGEFAKLLPKLMRRLANRRRVLRAQAIYNTLVTQMQRDGYRVETYQFPFIVDERKAGSTLLQRLFGLVDVVSHHEVLMLYSSFAGKWGPAALWSYGWDMTQADLAAADANVVEVGNGIGVGSTGGGVEMGASLPVLTWEELVRDLRLASALSDEVFVFSLEGCVDHGYLEQLRDFDWNGTVEVPVKAARKVDTARRGFQALLWAGSHPLPVLAGLAAVAAGVALLLRRRKR